MSVRERQQRAERQARNQEWKNDLPAYASDYLRKFDEEPNGIDVVLVCRVSTDKQAKNGDLDDQMKLCTKAVQKAGSRVVSAVKHVGSGADPTWLKRAARIARKRNAVILAESTDRLIRNPGAFQGPGTHTLQPRREDYQRLRAATAGVTLTTLLDPDATQIEVWSHQRKRGQHAKGKTGGRPAKYTNKTERRDALQPKAIEMRSRGISLGKIASTLNVCKSTIQKWVTPQNT